MTRNGQSAAEGRVGWQQGEAVLTSPPWFLLQVGWLARLFPLWLFTPWLEDALAAANPDTLR